MVCGSERCSPSWWRWAWQRGRLHHSGWVVVCFKVDSSPCQWGATKARFGMAVPAGPPLLLGERLVEDPFDVVEGEAVAGGRHPGSDVVGAGVHQPVCAIANRARVTDAGPFEA